jgi:hypothetical protein
MGIRCILIVNIGILVVRQDTRHSYDTYFVLRVQGSTPDYVLRNGSSFDPRVLTTYFKGAGISLNIKQGRRLASRIKPQGQAKASCIMRTARQS